MAIQKTIKKLKLAEQTDDKEFWKTQSFEERLSAIEHLRKQYVKLFLNGIRPGFQRVYKSFKQE